MDRKHEEFCNLTQGRRTVDEYNHEFNRLAHYSTEEVSTDSKKQERFRRGLNSELRRELNLHDFVTFQVLVKMAMKAEDMIPSGDVRKHPRDEAASSSDPQKRRIWIPASLFHQNNPPRPSFVPPRPPALSHPAPPNNPVVRPIYGACFRCGQPGHYSRNCSVSQNAPPSAKGNPNVRAKPSPKVSTTKPSTSESLGRVNQISAQEIDGTSNVILGTLPVNLFPLPFFST